VIEMPSLYATMGMLYDGKGFADAIGSYPRGIDKLELLPGKTSKSLLVTSCPTKRRGAGIYEFSGAMGDGKRWSWHLKTLSIKIL